MRPAVLTWLGRGCFAAILVALAITPGPASAARPCTARGCQAAGRPRWAQLLPGPWVAEPGLAGTTPAQGEAYAAMGRQLAVIGFGSTVQAYRASTGAPLWVSSLAGLGAGAQIVSVRSWPRVITAGVTVPGRAPQAASTRREVVLSAATGRLIRSFPAAPFGGAVSAAAGRTVIVGSTAVTCYSNRTGAVLWSRPTGPAAQAWKADGNELYVAVAAGGYLSGAPVRALRKINLRTGAQRLVRPLGTSFQGTLSRAVDGVVVFTGARGSIAYSGSTGAWLWRRAGALPEVTDPADGLLYLSDGSALAGVDPRTGRPQVHVSGGSAPGPSGIYAVRHGTVLGLDPGAGGDAWGYSAAAGQVLWTNPAVPWPHFFVDLSGIGGSTSPWSTAVLLATCAQTGAAVPGGAGQVCVKPELTALNW
ncbi:MAG TPA: PQQ-binding-like beta-propeller repeat protein [Streptosporangiaceae bacterium]|nr:PQQ-binding-like beta-propeller repeat protein [Streptosporangiaceae bacterium]